MNNKKLIELLKFEKEILLDGKNLEEVANMTPRAKISFTKLIAAYLKYHNDIIKGNYKIVTECEYIKEENKYIKTEIIKTDSENYEDLKKLIFDLAYIATSATAEKTYNLRYLYTTDSDMVKNIQKKENIKDEEYSSIIYIPKIGWIKRPSYIKIDTNDYSKRLSKIMKAKNI